MSRTDDATFESQDDTSQMLQAVALRNIQGILLARRRAELQLLAAKQALHTSNQALRRALEDRERLLESERSAREEAERASVMKDEFLATLSHELRTPLTAILGWSQILMTGRTPAHEVRRGVESIARNARAQAQLIDDLLDMSRIVSGKLRLDMQPLDLGALAAAAVDTAMPSAQAKQIQLGLDVPAASAMVQGDARRLQQVVWNLLSNAVKFTPAGGRVDIEVRCTDGRVLLRVRDDGPGIEPSFLPFVFDRFRQADASTTRIHGGLGIGLAIARHLVELHGGEISVSSPGEGAGAAFSVELPMASPAMACDSAQLHGDGGVAQAQARLGGTRVLVVDDDVDSRALVALVLSEAGAQVDCAEGAAAAMRQIALQAPDVLVCDIGMPGTDGYGLMRQVRLLDDGAGAVPAIALTAFTRADDRNRAFEAGFQVHLGKPFDPDELVDSVLRLGTRTRQ